MSTLGDYLESIRYSLELIEKNGKSDQRPSHEEQLRQIDDLADALAEIYERHGEV